jgi:hypothetical protein
MGVDCPVYHPVDMVNLRLNGMGTVTILWVHTYCEVWSQCAALIVGDQVIWGGGGGRGVGEKVVGALDTWCIASKLIMGNQVIWGGICKGTSVYILTLSSLLSPVNSYSTLCICTSTPTPVPTPIVNDYHHQRSTTSISNSRWPLHIKVVNSRLLPPLAPQPHRTSIRYMATRPHHVDSW